jgi:hypothetical protein
LPRPTQPFTQRHTLTIKFFITLPGLAGAGANILLAQSEAVLGSALRSVNGASDNSHVYSSTASKASAVSRVPTRIRDNNDEDLCISRLHNSEIEFDYGSSQNEHLHVCYSAADDCRFA